MIMTIITLSGCTEKSPEQIGKTPISGITETPVTITEIPIANGIMFNSMDRGNLNTAEIDKPGIFIASNMTEAQKFMQWDSGLANKIRSANINFDDVLLVGIFQVMNTSGYEITVKQIIQETNKIRITVMTAGPTEAASPVISYPYDIVAVQKQSLKIIPGMTWEVYTEDNNLLARITYP